MTPPDTFYESSTDLFLLEKILFDLFSVARKEDPSKGLSAEITHDERVLIEHVITKLGPADNEFIASIEANYFSFKGVMREVESGKIKTFNDLKSIKSSDAGISPMYRRFFEFFLMMDLDKYTSMGLKKEHIGKHMGLLIPVLKYFNIRSKGQLDLLRPILESLREGDDKGVLNEELEHRLNPNSELSRTMMKDFLWTYYKNDGQRDPIKEDIANNFGKILFGYAAEEILEMAEEMSSENRIVRGYSSDPALLKGAESRYLGNMRNLEKQWKECLKKGYLAQLKAIDSFLKGAAKKQGIEEKIESKLMKFIGSIRFALADNILSNDEDALLNEVGRYFCIRDQEVYTGLVNYVRADMGKEKEKGDFRVLVVNGDPAYTNHLSGIMERRLGKGVYDIRFATIENAMNGFDKIKPHVLFVDPCYDDGKFIIEIIKTAHPELSIYALMSRGRMSRELEEQTIADLGVKGCFHVNSMFPKVPDAIRGEYRRFKGI